MGEPNGYRIENCAAIWTDIKRWNDQSCETKTCFFCDVKVFTQYSRYSSEIQLRHVKQTPFEFHLRGLPPSSPHDTFFTLDEERRHDWVLSGATNSRIWWDNVTERWTLSIYNRPEQELVRQPLKTGTE